MGFYSALELFPNKTLFLNGSELREQIETQFSQKQRPCNKTKFNILIS